MVFEVPPCGDCREPDELRRDNGILKGLADKLDDAAEDAFADVAIDDRVPETVAGMFPTEADEDLPSEPDIDMELATHRALFYGGLTQVIGSHCVFASNLDCGALAAGAGDKHCPRATYLQSTLPLVLRHMARRQKDGKE